jgi:hypothetical protein
VWGEEIGRLDATETEDKKKKKKGSINNKLQDGEHYESGADCRTMVLDAHTLAGNACSIMHPDDHSSSTNAPPSPPTLPSQTPHTHLDGDEQRCLLFPALTEGSQRL